MNTLEQFLRNQNTNRYFVLINSDRNETEVKKKAFAIAIC